MDCKNKARSDTENCTTCLNIPVSLEFYKLNRVIKNSKEANKNLFYNLHCFLALDNNNGFSDAFCDALVLNFIRFAKMSK